MIKAIVVEPVVTTAKRVVRMAGLLLAAVGGLLIFAGEKRP